MTSADPLPPLHDRALNDACATTVTGWLWHCDNHDTHGNADSRDEAEVYAEAHHEYFAKQHGGDPCDVVVWLRTPHPRGEGATTTLVGRSCS